MIEKLKSYQVYDVGRGSYFVGIQQDGQTKNGQPIYKDRTGRRFVITDIHVDND